MTKQITQIQHKKYVGSTDAEGYPTGDNYEPTAQLRDTWGWYPLSSQLSQAQEYDRRVMTSKVLLVPDPAVFSPRDRVALPGDDIDDDAVAFFVSEDNRDYSTGPFSRKQRGEVVIERVSG
ncbi:hypothetical protein [Mycobacterium intracellulare]|uniref:hypothetical protein n=1 Tax=Mycobacterium intracellulare TaxID=1767 RepID=UPI00080BD9F6|nr:hypothetical protein [Mycobacterium intracellulare]OCB15081.1 hypothetical protein A5689_26875 [Mycobacterium intracellulare subsp. yongonense]